MTPFIAHKYYDEDYNYTLSPKVVTMLLVGKQGRNQNSSKKRILLVDDEYDVIFTIKLVLERNGFD